MKWLLLLTAAFQIQLLIIQGKEDSAASILADFGCPLPLARSCQRIKLLDPTAPSKMYTITIATSCTKCSCPKTFDVTVYCEMGLDGGGYTFLTPESILQLQFFEPLSLFTDRTSFLLRVRKTDGSQPYAVLKQLPQYADILLKIGLSENVGYNPPVNTGGLVGQPFLYFGFLPKVSATNNNVQGLQVNGFNDVFTNCDKNPNSYIALFPNFPETTPSTYHVPGAVCDQIFSHLLPNPSGRVMPPELFMFGETHWGGCGCYKQTNQIPGILSFAIGFR